MRVLLALACVLLAGCGAKPDTPSSSITSKTTAEYRGTLQVPASLGTGDQTLTFTLADARTGAPVGDANVSAAANMVSPRLPAAAVTGRAQGNGVYLLPMRLPTPSAYRVEVTARRPGHADGAFSFPITAGN